MMNLSKYCLLMSSAGLIGVAVIGSSARAQESRAVDPRDLETRSSLEAEARAAEAAHRTSEAWLLKQRLQRGDFQDGDRIVVRLLGTTPLPGTNTLSDTITVRSGKLLPLPHMADLPLDGVLRSELNEKLTSHIAKFLRDSSVTALPLLRLAVLGEVRSPGYYYTSADVLLSDVVMKAGGPTATADLNNVLIRRGGDVIWSAQDTRTAMADGLSLDRLHLRAGDEMTIGQNSSGRNWTLIYQSIAAGAGLLLALFRFSR